MADGGDIRGLALRLPPQNLMAEQALLGSLLANNRAYERVVDILRPEHFADPVHGRLYQHITEKILDGHIADAVTIKLDFEHSGILDEVGGTAYLAQLLASMVAVNMAGEYGQTIQETWLRRQLIDVGEMIINNAFGAEPGLNGAGQITAAEQALSRLGLTGDLSHKLVQAGAAISRVISDADQTHRTGLLPGIRWGMPTIDRALDGLVDKATLTLLGGLPGSGKTALIGQMGKSLGLRIYDAGIAGGLSPVQAMRQPGMLLISLEMTVEQIALRLAAHEAGLNAEAIRNGRLDEVAAVSLARARTRTEFMAFRIHDMVGMSIRLLPQKILMHLRRQRELVVVVDNLLTRGAEPDEGRGGRGNELSASSVSWLTGQLKALSNKTGVPIIALTHIPRPMNGVVRRPTQQDVKWGGEGDADNVMFVHRPFSLMSTTPPPKNPREGEERYQTRKNTWAQERDDAREVAEIIVAKQRQGPGGIFRMRWHGPTTSFREWGGLIDNLEY